MYNDTIASNMFDVVEIIHLKIPTVLTFPATDVLAISLLWGGGAMLPLPIIFLDQKDPHADFKMWR